MPRCSLLALPVLAAGFCPAAAEPGCPQPEGDAVAVAEVTPDADLVLADGRRVLLAGAEASGADAAFRDALASRVAGRSVRLAPSGMTRDRWGRVVAYVWLGGELVERALIAEGVALRAPGLPDKACARALEAAERGDWTAPDVSNGRLGHPIRAEGRVMRLRKSGKRVYMKLEIAGARPLTVTIRDDDFETLSHGADWTGSTLRVRGHLEWWGEPTISIAAPWDIARKEDLTPP